MYSKSQLIGFHDIAYILLRSMGITIIEFKFMVKLYNQSIGLKEENILKKKKIQKIQNSVQNIYFRAIGFREFVQCVLRYDSSVSYTNMNRTIFAMRLTDRNNLLVLLLSFFLWKTTFRWKMSLQKPRCSSDIQQMIHRYLHLPVFYTYDLVRYSKPEARRSSNPLRRSTSIRFH